MQFTRFEMEHNTIVLDIQCFKSNFNSFIIKEITALHLESGTILFHHIVQPPYNRDLLSPAKLRESNWLTTYFHGLDWNIGDISYSAVLEKLRESCYVNPNTTILLKGSEKRLFIQSLIREECLVLDLETVGCPSLDSLNSMYTSSTLRCNYHKYVNHRCSLSNAINLRRWYLLNQKNVL